MKDEELFHDAKFESAYLKVGILGFQGSGKTFTASSIAIGLHKHIGSKKPVCFMDTETGSDFMIKRFNQAGIKLKVSKTRSFTEMLKIIDRAEEISDILIIDSVSTVWFDFMESFKKKKNRDKIYVWDWGVLKPTWRNEFTDPRYLNNKLHIIICGRAGYTYDSIPDENGKMEVHKTGTKMKAESEFGYEPNLLLEMERVPTDEKGKKKLVHRCHVIKDRADILDGMSFDDPKFENFLPTIKILNFGGEHKGVDLSKDSQDIFDSNGDPDWRKELRTREVTLDEIKQELVVMFPGHSGADKVSKINILENVFGTKSWVTIEENIEKEFPSDILKKGLEKIREIIQIQIKGEVKGKKEEKKIEAEVVPEELKKKWILKFSDQWLAEKFKGIKITKDMKKTAEELAKKKVEQMNTEQILISLAEMGEEKEVEKKE